MKKRYSINLMILIFLASGSLLAQDYTGLLKENLLATRAADGLLQQDLEELTIYNQSISRTSGVVHVYAGQKISGIEIFNGNVSAAFQGDEIIHVGDNLRRNVLAKINTTNPVLSPIQAATDAASALGAGGANFTILNTISDKEVLLSQGGVSYDNVPVKLVFQTMDDGELRLAWDLSIHMTNAPHWYSVRVDALSGEIISQHDWVVSCTFESHNHIDKAQIGLNTTENSFGFKNEQSSAALAGERYNVFPMPLESPNHGSNEIVLEPQDLVASPFGWHDTDGVEGAEFTITRGNNVLAQTDFDDNLNTIEDSPDGGAELDFNFEYNFDTAPINMIEAVTTNLFYWNNVIHDVMYYYGFDEAAGNFQETNYSGAGAGSDFVVAGSHVGTVECNDPNNPDCIGNASFQTPPDGFNPGMRMYLWNPGGDAGESLTINGGSLDGSYLGVPANFGETLSEEIPITANLALVEDNNDGGVSTDTVDACDTIINGSDINGNIAVIRRGECEFGFKVLAAENEGAIAVIVVNNVADDPISMAPGALGDQVTIPSIMVSQGEGESIIAALQQGEEINVSLLNEGPFQLDGSVDNGIIAHEYAHGISNRLTAGPAAVGCLQNAEQMGEGWSDYYGLIFTMTSDDFAEEARGIGTYASGQPIDGGGIRLRPYSTDFAVNEFTYGQIAQYVNDQTPHNTGHVWATILWDMTWTLIDQYGFDEDLYNGTGGNNIALQLVTDGLKLQPCNPGFVSGRDAILAAVDINTMIPEEEKNEVKCSIWGSVC